MSIIAQIISWIFDALGLKERAKQTLDEHNWKEVGKDLQKLDDAQGDVKTLQKQAQASADAPHTREELQTRLEDPERPI